MILSNLAIQDALRKGALIIEPKPMPERPGSNGEDCPYNTSAVDLHLAEEVAEHDVGNPITFSLRGKGFAPFFAKNSKVVTITDKQPYKLFPQMLVLARTREVVGLPIRSKKPCLAARIEGRSSYARCGLQVHCTAPTIHAGFNGTITLELVNHGPYVIELSPGDPICQLIIERVEGEFFQNPSQFQGQRRASGQAR